MEISVYPPGLKKASFELDLGTCSSNILLALGIVLVCCCNDLVDRLTCLIQVGVKSYLRRRLHVLVPDDRMTFFEPCILTERPIHVIYHCVIASVWVACEQRNISRYLSAAWQKSWKYLCIHRLLYELFIYLPFSNACAELKYLIIYLFCYFALRSSYQVCFLFSKQGMLYFFLFVVISFSWNHVLFQVLSCFSC